MENNKIEISRSFSKKVQIKQYEPVDIFCSIKQEADEKDFAAVSAKLFRMAKEQVERDMEQLENQKARRLEKKQEAKNVAETEAGDLI